MKLDITSPEILHDYEKASALEWLETNGLGGYASGTLSGAHTRRYHGMFVPAAHPPVGRNVLLSKLEETILLNGHSCLLACSQFPGYVSSDGLVYLSRFVKDPFPTFYYTIGDFELKKTIVMLHEQDVVIVTYEVLKASSEAELWLKPFVAFRDFHSLTHANSFISSEATFGEGVLEVQPYQGQNKLYINVKDAKFSFKPEWCYKFEYPVEKARGLDFLEDTFEYGTFKVAIKEGSKINVVISLNPSEDMDVAKVIREEKRRRDALLEPLAIKDDFTKHLALAADQFIVQRGDLKTIIAGYHWFSDWGRDTMISLPGICLVTGRYDEAKKILQAFAKAVDMGMIPNRFPDEGEVPEYNTVDATLWYFVAIKKYYDYSGDKDFIINEMLPVLEEIIAWHNRGTRYGIHVTEDGLIYAGQQGVQLTWMDAKVGDWVVTPRQGKPVEINALWYNALMIMADFYDLKNDEVAEEQYRQRAENVKQAFLSTFINPYAPSLYDCVNGDYRSTEVRPNQVFAISLPYALLDKEKSQQVLEVIEAKLLTPVGLRSLSPDDFHYVGLYRGDQLSRDGSYHQGTVWSWLLGPYITAKIKTEGEEGRKFVIRFLKDLEAHLLEAGVGTVSEIFDGNAPFVPSGCIAQAWGVAELLRAYIEDVYPQLPPYLRNVKR